MTQARISALELTRRLGRLGLGHRPAGRHPALLAQRPPSRLTQVAGWLGRAALVATTLVPLGVQADAVSHWNEIALEAGRSENFLMQARALAMVHAAAFDAANAIEPRFAPYMVRAKPGARIAGELAVAAAAHTVLLAAYPGRRPLLDAALAASAVQVAPGQARADAIAFGMHVGHAVIAARRSDGASSTATHRLRPEPGHWRPTPPAELPALAPQWARVTPFLLAAPHSFAPRPPPDLDSVAYARELTEVRKLGARDSSARTPDQTAASVFWTGYAPHLWSSAARQALKERPQLALVERARVMAMLSGAIADAFVVGWASKYGYDRWRPITAIREAADDGNRLTQPDREWEPLIVTPPFPCYLSAHAITSGAAQAVLAHTLGSDRQRFTIENAEVGITRDYDSFSELAREAVEARIWSGVHFRSSQTTGAAVGRALGEWVARHRMTPL